MGTQKLAADLEEWLLFTILSRLHTTLTLFHGYSLRWCWFSFPLKGLMLPLRRMGPHGESQPAVPPGTGISVLQGAGYHNCSADSTCSSSCSELFKHEQKWLWRPQSTWTCILSEKKMDWCVNAGSWELNTYDIMCLTNTSIQSWSEIISFSLPLMFFFFLSSNT